MNRDTEKGRPGQFFDDYLKEQGVYETTTEQAVKRVLAFQLAEATRHFQGGNGAAPPYEPI